MNALKKCVWLDAIRDGPFPPDALDDGDRIDERSIHVEQEGPKVLRKYTVLLGGIAVHLILPLKLSGQPVSILYGDLTESIFRRSGR
ncbi:conserved hypothetical protein [Agrobacterium salinitolerans str. Hayward 0363]|nr:conserved hypothetical protein [Agrobacterium salinitolerans str. Hayward 0363]